MMLIKRHFRSLLPLQRHLTSVMQFVLVLALVDMVTGAEMCTKSVPIQQDQESRKVHVLRRVPATCSNWEKAWSWITKKDCGTKYRLDLVDLPSHDVITYRRAKVCCDWDTQCKEAQEAAHESGASVTDDKFLAIVLGSTAAALVLLVLVVGISLCHRKKQCSLLCEEQRHVYASAEEADDCSEGEEHKACQPSDDETENKVTESEYAEINDTGLPRYTDIFKESSDLGGPFTRASAPPLPSYEAGRERHVHFETHECSTHNLLLQSGAARQDEEELDQPGPAIAEAAAAAAAAPRAEGGGKGEITPADTSYYNVAKQKPVKASVREEVILNHHVIPDDRVVVLNGAPAAPAVGCTCGGGGGGGGGGVTGGAKPASSQTTRSAEKDKRSSATYDRLEEQTERDEHEYQRLNNSSRGQVTSSRSRRLTSPSASNHPASVTTPSTKVSASPIPTEDESDASEEDEEEEEKEEEESPKILLSSSGSAVPLSPNGHIETATTC